MSYWLSQRNEFQDFYWRERSRATTKYGYRNETVSAQLCIVSFTNLGSGTFSADIDAFPGNYCLPALSQTLLTNAKVTPEVLSVP